MTLRLDLPPDVEAGLQEKAARRGEDVRTYALRVLALDVAGAVTVPEPGAGGGLDVAALLEGVVGGLTEEGDPDWAENAEAHYGEALRRRRAEGHV